MELQRRRPFVVRHPEMMTVTTTLVFIALPPLAAGVPDRHVYCDPIHITHVEPLDGNSQISLA